MASFACVKRLMALRGDPEVALRDLPEPILLDEWQAVPSVLGAVKRAVDADPRPGRFLLTDSVRAGLEKRSLTGNRLARAGGDVPDDGP